MVGNMKLYTLSIILGLLIHEAHADVLPTAFSAIYHGRKYVVATAEAVIALNRHGNYYKYTMDSDVKAPLYRNHNYDCSVMLIRDGDIYPLEHMHQGSKKAKYNSRTQFDWDERTATVVFEDGHEKTVANLPSPVWDPMSIQIKIMYDITNKNLVEEKVYTIIEHGKLSTYPMGIVGEESIAHSAVLLKTIEVGSDSADHSNKFWFSQDFFFIPIKMEINDVVVEMVSDVTTAVTAEQNNTIVGRPVEIPRCRSGISSLESS